MKKGNRKKTRSITKRVAATILTLALALVASVSAVAAEAVVLEGNDGGVAGNCKLTITGVLSQENLDFETSQYGELRKESNIVYTVSPDFTLKGYAEYAPNGSNHDREIDYCSAYRKNESGIYELVAFKEGGVDLYGAECIYKLSENEEVIDCTKEELYASGELFYFGTALFPLGCWIRFDDPNASELSTPHQLNDTQNKSIAKINAIPIDTKVLVNSKEAIFDAYTINGNNYFKLRDIAKIANSSIKQFEVSWDNTNKSINLLTGKSYTATGGELVKGDDTSKTAVLSSSAIYKDGEAINLTAYTINGNTYFKLRDLGQALDFSVSWDDANNAVMIDFISEKKTTEGDGIADTTQSLDYNTFLETKQQVSWAFATYAEPDFKAEIKEVFEPQTVTVLEKKTMVGA